MEIDILEKNIDHNNNDFIEGITEEGSLCILEGKVYVVGLKFRIGRIDRMGWICRNKSLNPHTAK